MKTKFSKVRSLLGRSELILIFAAALLMGLPLFAAATSPQIQSELQAVARELQLSDQPYGGSEETDLANEGSDGAQGEEVSADSDTSTTINDQPAQETQDSAGDPAADSGDTGADETNTVSSDDTVEAGGYIGIEPFAVGATDFVGNFTDLQSAMTTGSTTRVIAIMNNITLTSPITVPAGRDITLVTNGTTNLQTGVHPTNARFTLFAPPGQAISSPTPANTTVAARSDINANRHIYISGNSTLNLVNIVIDGGNIPAASATPYGGGIQATANATVNMRGRSIIQNNQQIFGGGLLMASGTFSMTHNAEIVNNRVVSNFNSGTPGFALTPGTPPAGQQMPRWITLDSPAGTAGRNTVLGGGILLMSSAASMADTAQIRSNETRLTFVNTHSTFAYPTDPGPGSGQNPAALPGAPVAFTLADSGNGGGVYMDGGTFDMTGNAGIASNGAHGTFSTDVNGMAANFTRNSAGGGVFIRGGGLFSTSDPGPNHVHINANITRSTSTAVPPSPPLLPDMWNPVDRADNIARRRVSTPIMVGNGAGVHMTGAGTALTMSDGTRLSRNVAQVHGGASHGGAGVYLDAGAVLNMEDTATIGGPNLTYANHFFDAAGSGAGVMVQSIAPPGSQVNMSDSANLSFNRNNNSGSGGGILVAGASTVVTIEEDAFVSNNRGGNSGGGIQQNAGLVLVRDDAMIEGNRVNPAGAGGGGVQVSGGTFDMGDNSVIRNHYRNTADSNSNGIPIPVQNGGGMRITTGGIAHVRNNAQIYNNVANTNGGGVLMDGAASQLHMHNAAAIRNNRTNGVGAANLSGGGGVYITNGTFHFNSGMIGRNTVGTNSVQNPTVAVHPNTGGGGIFLANGTVHMGGTAQVVENSLGRAIGAAAHPGTVGAGTGGGGVRQSGGTFNMNGGYIFNHGRAPYTVLYGGGVFMTGGLFNMGMNAPGGSEIHTNFAVRDGGGMFIGTSASVPPATAMRLQAQNATFDNNHAGRDGGAIFTANYLYLSPLPLDGEYTNMNLNGMTFTRNSADTPEHPPLNAHSLTNIAATASVTIFAHPLNNYDINFIFNEVPSTGLTVGNTTAISAIAIAVLAGGVFVAINYVNRKGRNVRRDIVIAQQNGDIR